jgi:hypothetical protein
MQYQKRQVRTPRCPYCGKKIRPVYKSVDRPVCCRCRNTFLYIRRGKFVFDVYRKEA